MELLWAFADDDAVDRFNGINGGEWYIAFAQYGCASVNHRKRMGKHELQLVCSPAGFHIHVYPQTIVYVMQETRLHLQSTGTSQAENAVQQ